MEFTLYILECADESFYIGHTDNLGQRLAKAKGASIPRPDVP
ncbi:MAG TPA: GIY-YIG nuclease family protein [Rhodanobacter sp.]